MKKEKKEEKNSGRIYLMKDGKRQMSNYNFLLEVEKARRNKEGDQRISDVTNPTHNFKLLKEFRLRLFEKAKQKFITDRAIDKTPVTNDDLNALYIKWLNHQLSVTSDWESKLPVTDQIEVGKFRKWVKSEIEKTDKEANPAKAGNGSPIMWMGKPGQLIYLLELLRNNSEFLPASINVHSTIRNHFINSDGKPFKQLAQVKQNYQNNKTEKPTNAGKIDSIADKLKAKKN